MKSSFEARPLVARHAFVPHATQAVEGAAEQDAAAAPDAEAAAHAAGVAEGHAQAEARLREPVERAVRALGDALEQLREVHRDESGALADAIVELALAVASRIVSTELRENAEALAPLIQEALQALGTEETVEIVLANDDAERVREGALPALERLRDGWQAELVADPALRPGEALVRSGATSVDLRVAAILERFRSELDTGGDS